MYQFQKTSNYGTSTPAVARTLPQGDELLGFFKATKQQKDACLHVLAELKRHLVRCVEICDRVSKEIDEGILKLDTLGPSPKIHGNSITLPSVPDLHSNAEAFLQSAKLAIRECAQLIQPFHGVAGLLESTVCRWLQERALTPPSSGPTTAGRSCALRPHRARRCGPLMSNVRRHRKHRAWEPTVSRSAASRLS